MIKFKKKTLGELIKIQRGFAFEAKDYVSKGILSIRASNFTNSYSIDLKDSVYLPDVFFDKYADYQLNTGDVLIVMVGATTGKLAIIPPGIGPCLQNQNTWNLKPIDEDELDRKYLFYWLRKNSVQILGSKVSGTARGYLKQEDFLKHKIVIPDVNEQRRLVHSLTLAESALEKRRQTIRLADEFVKSAFLEMFGRNSKQMKITDIFEIKTGKLDANAAVESGEYPFFTCAKETFRIDNFAYDEESLILSGNNANAEYSVKHYKGKFNAYQRTYIFNLKDRSSTYEYFKIALENELNTLKSNSIGSNTKYLTMSIFDRLTLPVPSSEGQKKFADLVQKVEQLKDKQKQSEAQLQNLFNSLMQRAFKGEL